MAGRVEPPRYSGLDKLQPAFAARLLKLLEFMKREGFEPLVYETYRSPERQKYLYSIGRTRDLGRKPVTWTLHSKHMEGLAADIIDAKKYWSNSKFFDRLRHNAALVGLKVLRGEGCHVESY